jgi:uncharacterized protein YdeI (YjbR/CyaY-like superfamily)
MSHSPEFYADSRQSWRKWLQKNNRKEKNVWLVIYKKDSGVPSLTYAEAVEEALCFGWIDSKPNKRDDKSYLQFFAKRNPKSKWSALNKKRVAVLIKQGLMQPAGMEMIELAKKTGTWTALDEIDKLTLPTELQKAFNRNKKALVNWDAFPPSTRRGILEWISNAKREETRMKRIEETVSFAAQNIRANQYIPKTK